MWRRSYVSECWSVCLYPSFLSTSQAVRQPPTSWCLAFNHYRHTLYVINPGAVSGGEGRGGEEGGGCQKPRRPS